MKLKRLFTAIIATLLVICSFALTACDNGGDDSSTSGGGSTGSKELTMEAEYINLDGVKGAGLSSDQQGVQMIYGEGTEAEKKLWSNGYYVYCTYATNLSLEFKFTAEADANGSISMFLGSECGNIDFGPTILKVELNGKEITYTPKKINVKQPNEMTFTEVKVTTNAKIKKGENVIKLTVLENTLRANGGTAGPCVDCIKVKSTTNLSWTPKTDNPSKRGEM